MDWYYRDGDKQIGPVDDEAVSGLVTAGKISPTTPVWRDGMEDWAEPGQTELASLFPQVPQFSQPVTVVLIEKGVELARFDIGDTPLVLGQADDCAVCIPEPSVLGHHTQLSLRDGTVYIEDLSSTNGTTLNGQSVAGLQPLRSGDALQLGDWSVEIRLEPALTAPPPLPPNKQTATTTPPTVASSTGVLTTAPVRTLRQMLVDWFRVGARRIILANEKEKNQKACDAGQQELDCIHIALGTKASAVVSIPLQDKELQTGIERKQHELKLAQAQETASRQALIRANEDLANTRGKNARRVQDLRIGDDAASADSERLTELERQAANELAAIDRDITALQTHLADAAAGRPTTRPLDVLLTEKRDLARKKAEKEDSHKVAQANAAAGRATHVQKKTALRTAENEASRQESQKSQGVLSAQQAVNQAGAKTNTALREYGQILHQSAAFPVDCHVFGVDADRVSAELIQLKDKMVETTRQVGNITPALRRLAWGAVAVLIASVCLLIISWPIFVAAALPLVVAAALPGVWGRLWPLTFLTIGVGWMVGGFLPAISNRIIRPDEFVTIGFLGVGAVVTSLMAMRYLLAFRPRRLHWVVGALAMLATFAITQWAFIPFIHMAQTIAEKGVTGGWPMAILRLIGDASLKQEQGSLELGERFYYFIVGVGVPEETAKLIPLLVLVAKGMDKRLGKAGFLWVGFLSGLGFGICEALTTYAVWTNFPTHANLSTQVLRWFACVPSHAIYTAIDAALLWMIVPMWHRAKSPQGKVGCIALAISVIAVLHGVYNVLNFNSFLGIGLDAIALGLLAGGFVLVHTRFAARTEPEHAESSPDPSPSVAFRCIVIILPSLNLLVAYALAHPMRIRQLQRPNPMYQGLREFNPNAPPNSLPGEGIPFYEPDYRQDQYRPTRAYLPPMAIDKKSLFGTPRSTSARIGRNHAVTGLE